MKIEKGKFYRTIDGTKVIIYETEGTFNGTIHGATLQDIGTVCRTWDRDGRYAGTGYDLAGEWEEKPDNWSVSSLPEGPKLEGWINIYSEYGPWNARIYCSRDAAKSAVLDSATFIRRIKMREVRFRKKTD